MVEQFDSEAPVPKRQGPMPWMVTFGDLLTLLLCFFLCIVSLGPLGHDVKNKANKRDSEKKGAPADAVLPKSAAEGSGTDIADNKPNGSLSGSAQTIRLVMRAAEVEPDRAQLLMGKAIEDGRAAQGELADLELQGCGAETRDREFRAPLAVLYEEARLRGVTDSQVRIGMGSGCSSSENESGSIVAVLRFVNHG